MSLNYSIRKHLLRTLSLCVHIYKKHALAWKILQSARIQGSNLLCIVIKP